jgi:signal-transduction protein with cAMP-binding, CBS, and nucleotidyltransferase domain
MTSLDHNDYHVLATYEQGALIGYEGYVTSNECRFTRLRALEDTECFVITKDLLSKVFIGIGGSAIPSKDGKNHDDLMI